MQKHVLDLAVGDVVQVGDHLVTIIDIEDDCVVFRIEDTFGAELLVESPNWAQCPR